MSRRTTFMIGAGLVLAVLIIYWPALFHGFVDFDDPEYARDNPHVRAGLTSYGTAWAFSTMYIANWHPLTWLSLMLDSEIHGWLASIIKRYFNAEAEWLYPRMFHFTNLALHSVNVLLVFGLLKRMTGFAWRSAMVAALFAVHPMHVESVAWVAERKDVLSTLFGLLAIRTYLEYAQWSGMREYLFVVVFFACSLMSKATLVTLPCVLLLLDYWPLGRFQFAPRTPLAKEQFGPPRPVSRLILEKAPLLLIAAVVSAATWSAQRGSNELEEGDWVPPHLASANAVVSYVRYLGKLIWPNNLAVLYPHPSLVSGETWPTWMIAGSMALLLVITVLAFSLRCSRPSFMIGWLWFLGTLVPVVGFVQIGRQAMADRYAYVPYLGLYIMVVWGVSEVLARWPGRKQITAALACVALLALGAVSSHQVKYWSDSVTLFQHALDVTERNWLMHNNLAGVLNRQAVVDKDQGRPEEAERKWNLAMTHLDAALKIYPEVAWLHNHYGAVLGIRGRLYESQQRFERAIELDPDWHEYHLNLGLILQRRGHPEQAINEYQRAIAIKPDYTMAHQNLGLALAEQGRLDEAIAGLEKARKANRSAAGEYNKTIAEIENIIKRSVQPPASRPRS